LPALGRRQDQPDPHLLAQRPANERWAVLINEFGQIGLDAALLTLMTTVLPWVKWPEAVCAA
jgi:hypothetical protein